MDSRLVRVEWSFSATILCQRQALLIQEVVDKLVNLWPVTVDAFATCLHYRLPLYFSPSQDEMAAGMDALIQELHTLCIYAFPLVPLIRKVLHRLTF